MIKRIYTIPLSGSQDQAMLVGERARVGNIFDTARQKIIVYKTTDAGESTISVMTGLATFADIDDAAKVKLLIQTDATNPLYVNGLSVSSLIVPGATGTILRSNGTNWVATTNIYPSTTSANQILYATSANVIGSSSGFTYDGTTLIVSRTINLTNTAVGNNILLSDDGAGGTILTISRQASNEVRINPNTSNGFLTFYSSGSERLRIDASGNVGIGVTPTSKFHLKDGHIRVSQTTAPTVSGTGTGLNSVTLSSNSTDTHGTIQTSTSFLSGTITITVTFNIAYTVAPTVLFSAAGATAGSQVAGGAVWVDNVTTTSFDLHFSAVNNDPYFNYHVIE